MQRKAVFKLLYPFEIPALLYALVGFLLARQHGVTINWRAAFGFSYDLLILREVLYCSFVLLAIVYLRKRFHRGDEGSDRRQVLSELKGTAGPWLRPWKDWRRWLELLRALLAIKIVILVHTHLKQAIPIINPTLYDDQLWEIDRVVHLGIDPVRLSLELLSAKYVTLLIDALYVLWYAVKGFFLVYFLFFAPPRRAWQFLTVYLLVWAIGGAFALLFPSLGPCYTNPELFSGLDLQFADPLQQDLWAHYQGSLTNPADYRVQIYGGIAAFPSLHVGFVALFTISVWRYRKLFWAMVVYSILIQIGSVHLGWHYAVDGYFATLLVVGLWFAVSPFFRDPEEPAGGPAVTDDPAAPPAPASAPSTPTAE